MNEIEIIRIAANTLGYGVMCYYLISIGRRITEKFLDRLIAAIMRDAEERAKLSEKIDALWKDRKP